MNIKHIIGYAVYIAAFVFSNLLVLFFGAWGLALSSIFLVPFDFVMRCYFHETWQGWELFFKMGALVLIASIATYLINASAINIANASAAGFICAQVAASAFYQIYINRSYMLKVNGSDAVGIAVDSVIFQLVAFGVFSFWVFASQFILKILGGFFWYWVLFRHKDKAPQVKND